MPKKTGVCINVSNCTKARSRELQTVEATNFVCEECGKDLKEKKKKGGPEINVKLIIGAIAAILILVGVYFGITTGIGEEETTTDTTTQTKIEEIVEPAKVTEPIEEVSKPVEPYTYEGGTQNGKPHGNGTMTFNTKHVVPGSKGNIIAQPGEYAQGKWINGEVNLVTLYQKDGNRVIITHK